MTQFHPRSAWELLHEDVEEPEWLIQGWLPKGPGYRVMFGGPPKGRKSTLALEMSVSLATHAPFLGHWDINSDRTHSVLYIQEENSTGMMRRDVAAILNARNVAAVIEPSLDLPREAWAVWDSDYSAEVSRLDLLIQTGFRLTVADHLQWLENVINERGYEYVVLDSLYRLCPGVDLDNGAQTSRVLDVLDTLRIHTSVTPIIIHHSGKTTSKTRTGVWQPPGDRLMHSTYLRAWYDGLVFTEPDRTGTLRIENEFREHEPPAALGLKQVEPRGTWERIDLAALDDDDDDGGGGGSRRKKGTSVTQRRQRITDLISMARIPGMITGGDVLTHHIDEGDISTVTRWLAAYSDTWGVSERALRADVRVVLENQIT